MFAPIPSTKPSVLYSRAAAVIEWAKPVIGIISALLNLSEVHLDFHGEYDIYKACKKKIFSNHDENSIAILNKEDNDVLELTGDIISNKMFFSSKHNGDCYINDGYIVYKGEKGSIKNKTITHFTKKKWICLLFGKNYQK